MVFASVYKIYVGFSSRRFTSDLRDAFVGGFINSTPHFNSVSNYLAKPELSGILKALVVASSLPLKPVETNFAVDSSGFSTSRFVRWYNKKYGRETDNREWIKLHLMCGTQTKIVTSVDVSGWTAGEGNPRVRHRARFLCRIPTRTKISYLAEALRRDFCARPPSTIWAVRRIVTHRHYDGDLHYIDGRVRMSCFSRSLFKT